MSEGVIKVKKCCLICKYLGYNIMGHFCILTTDIKELGLTDDLCIKFELRDGIEP